MNYRRTANTTLYFGTLISIISFSFIYYAPCNYFYFNSDHAIHVLMSKDFQLPRDLFYWGQNRLGSLLPMFVFMIRKLIPIHYLYLCSIVQYIFLLTGFLFLSTQINSRSIKTALCALIFLPPNAYNALILIGHPYSSQLFAGSLFVFFLFLLKKYLLTTKIVGFKQFFIALLLGLGANLFFIIGVWVSEFSAILILIPVYFILFEKGLRGLLFTEFRNFWFILVQGSFFLFFLAAFFLYKHVKSLYNNDAGYNNFFIDNSNDLKKNFQFFLEKLKTSLYFKDPSTLENSFNWFLIFLTVMVIIIQIIKRKRRVLKKTILINSLLVICFASTIFLFLSAWNLRSEFCPRYFTPVYIIFCFVILLFYDRDTYNKWIKFFISIGIIFFCAGFCYTVFSNKNLSTPFEQYGEYRKLPKGTLIADYWEAYLINSIAIDSLQSLPFDHLQVRNWDWKEIPLSEKNFYFLNAGNTVPGGLKDSIRQFGILFTYSGIKYNCNQTEVLLYYKTRLK